MQELQIKYKAQKAKHKQEVEGLLAQLAQQKEAMAELQEREEQLKNFNNSMVEAMNELQTAPPQAQHQELAQLLVDYESIKEGNQELSCVLSQKDQQISEINQQIQRVSEEKQTLIAQHQNNMIQMNQKVLNVQNQLQREQDKFNRQIKEMQSRFKKNQEQNLSQNVQNSQLLIQKTQQIQNMSQERDQWMVQMQALRKQIHFLEEQSSIYQTEKQQIIDQMQAQVSENEIQKQYIQSLRKQNQGLVDSLAAKEKQVTQVNENNKVLKRQVYRVSMDKEEPLNRQFIHKSRNLKEKEKEKRKKGGSVILSPEESERENDPLQGNAMSKFEQACRQIKRSKEENEVHKHIQRKNEQRLNRQIQAMMDQLAEVQGDLQPKEKQKRQLSHSMVEPKVGKAQEKYSSIPIKQRQTYQLFH